jgi:stress response protein YsnF
MEEVLVVEKRLMLKEEVRVTKSRHEVRDPKEVTLRSEEAVIERLPGRSVEKSTSGKD